MSRKQIAILGGAAIFITIILLQTAFFTMTPKKETKQEAPASSGIPFPVMMGQLSQNLIIWDRLGQSEKEEAVNAVMTLYKTRDNTAMFNDAKFYVNKINETLQVNPGVRGLDIMTVVRILAVMEYDFYNGQNKDELAKEVLGERAYAENRLRLQSQQK